MKSSPLLSGPVLTAFMMLAIFLTMTLMALGFPEKARLMPLLVGIPGSLLAVVQVLKEIRASTGERIPAAQPAVARRHERQMFAWLLLYFFGILGFGFIYAAPCLVLGFLYLGRKESLRTAFVGAVATWAILYGLFEQAFEIPLFDGFLIEWLLN